MNALRSAIVFVSLLFAAGGVHAQIAFRAAAQASVSNGVPTFQAAGTTVGAAAAVTPAWPAHAIGDIALLFIESTGGQPATLSTPAGFAAVANSPQATAETRITVFWARATSAAMAAPVVADPGNHVYAQILTYRHVIATGDPWDVTGGGVKAAASTSVTVTGVTTTVPNTLIVQAVARDNDSAAAAFSAQTNANLTGIVERSDAGTTAGNGGGFGVWDGVLAAAGATGNTTATVTSSSNAFLTVALRPAPGLTIAVPAGTLANDVMIASITYRPCSAASGAACTTTITPPAGWTQVNSVTDQTTGAGTGGFGNRLFVYRRVATGAEPANYTWAFGGTPVHNGAAGGIISFSGVETASPIVAEAGQTTASATSHAAPSIDTGAVTNTMLVSSHSANSSTLWTPPAGMTERVDAASLAVPDDLGLALEVNHELRAAAGATGTRTATWTAPPAADTGITHMLALRPAIAVNHYAISVLSASVANCDYAEVTIAAHNAAHGAVIAPSSRIVTLSTSVGSGVWQAGLVSGGGTWTPSGLNNGLATYQWSGAESSFTVRLRESAVTALSVNLSDGFVVEDPTEDPTISFVNSALRVSNGANAALAIGNQIASKPSNTGVGTQSLFLQAIRTDTATGACVSLFPNGSEVDFEVGAQCNNPAACTQNVTLTTTSISGSPTGNFVPNGAYPSTIRFRFTTANAEAPFFFSYADAGQITLQFRRLLPAPPAGVYVSGTSNAFVTRPFGLAFRGANAATAIQHGTLPTSALLAAAGDNFTMTLAAYRWVGAEDDGTGNPLPGANITDNGLTPNFASSTTVSATGNLPGVATGTLARGVGCAGAATVAAGSWSGGAATIGDWCYSEVGNAFLGATAVDYIVAGVNVSGNSGLDGTGAAGGFVGRFKPKHFAVTGVPTLTNRVALACASTFTYMNEGLSLGFTLEAQNTQNVLTQNYTGAYAKLNLATAASLGIGARSGATNLTPRVDSNLAPTGSFTNGSAALVARTGITRATPDTPDGPYAGTQFGIAPNDADPNAATGVQMGSFNLDADSVLPGDDHFAVGATTELRFGRLRLQNGYGPDTVGLQLPLDVQYWTAGGFALNVLDSCTTLARANIALTFTGPIDTPVCNTAVQEASIPFASGVSKLTLAAPGAGETGFVLLTPQLGTAAGTYCPAKGAGTAAATVSPALYLLGRWDDDLVTGNPDGNANTAYDDKPTGRATFGLYGSQPKNFIFFRENF